MTDGFDLPGAESTSAALRRVEAELGSALSAFGLAEELRLKACRERDSLARRCAVRFEEAEGLRAELASARQELDALRTVRDRLDRELAEVRTAVIELKAVERIPATKWVVAIGGDGPCALCGREIQRGEAYEYTPATQWRPGQCTHVHCPDRQGATPA